MHPVMKPAAVVITTLALTAFAHAQSGYKSPCANPANETTRTFFLVNTPSASDQNEILASLRDMIDPCIRIKLVPSQNAILINAPQEQLTAAEHIIQDLDKPQKTYRVVFTITETDGATTVATRQYSMDLAPSQHNTLKQMVQVPTIKTTYETKDTPRRNDMSYAEYGSELAALITAYGNSLRLTTHLEQSTLATEKSAAVPENPIVHRNEMESVVTITPGRQAIVGSMDIPSTGHRLQVTAIVEAS